MMFRTAIAIVCVSMASGCASITSSDMQNVSLNAKTEKNEPVTGAKCTLKNDKGTWQAEVPGFVAIRRSAEDLTVECKKEGQPDGLLRAISRAAGGMFGNIIFGGGIGAIIDHSRGVGYNYPDDLPVVMGQSVTIDRYQDPDAKEPAKPAVEPSAAPAVPAATAATQKTE